VNQIRVLVADDSPLFQELVCSALARDPQIEVVGRVSNGAEMLEGVRQRRPDVVVLDLEMPVMDGLEALQILMRTAPTPVVIWSAHTRQGAEAALRALELGAVEIVTKSDPPEEVLGDLVDKVKVAARARPRSRRAVRRPRVVAIAASTGGPAALADLFAHLHGPVSAPLIVVQHMPAGFTHGLARRLDAIGHLRVEEACEGMIPQPGTAYLAPGGQQLVVRNGRFALHPGSPSDVLRPCADVTFTSLAESFSPVLAVVLTGMGRDGLEGCRRIKAGGGVVVAQNEDTCTVYGMPRAVVEAGLADFVLPLDRIAEEIVRLTGG
jgi:two-component system chemotaxis response regulator CheB